MQVTHGATANEEKTISLELGDLMAKLEQFDKKLKYSKEDRQKLNGMYDTTRMRTWTTASTWQMSDKVEASQQGTQTQVTEAVANPGKTSKYLRNSRTIQMVALIHGLR